MTTVVTLDVADWRPMLSESAAIEAQRAIEEGRVIRLPRLPFRLTESERRFLSPAWSAEGAKNISLEGAAIKGATGTEADRADLAAMIARFAAGAADLVSAMFPRYAPFAALARSSYRPSPATGRDVSWRKDDSRLHVDAFPSRPNRGERILRVFTNVSPTEDRVWRIGEPFEVMAKHFLSRISDPLPGAAAFLAAIHVTKGRRSLYDHFMLNLHDLAKADAAYQRDCAQEVVRFAPGTTWLCFSDQVMHAAVSGQFMLEQTIRLPLSALYERARSPLATLERLTGRALVSSHS